MRRGALVYTVVCALAQFIQQVPLPSACTRLCDQTRKHNAPFCVAQAYVDLRNACVLNHCLGQQLTTAALLFAFNSQEEGRTEEKTTQRL